jgi:NADH-quinone oxidoreductase subunit L
MFHLITHAFFKALLFLGAGSVIHALSGEQDIRHMGRLRRQLRYTFPLLVIGNLALCGIFPFAAFSQRMPFWRPPMPVTPPLPGQFIWVHAGSGDDCLLQSPSVIPGILRIPAPAESAHGSHDDHPDHGHGHGHAAHHPHESPPSMILPLSPLALGAVAGGFLLEPWLLHAIDNSWQNGLVVHDHHQDIPTLVKWAPLFAALLGIFLAWLLSVAKTTLASRHRHAVARAVPAFLSQNLCG